MLGRVAGAALMQGWVRVWMLLAPSLARVEVLDPAADDIADVFRRYCPPGRRCEQSAAWHMKCGSSVCANRMYGQETQFINALKGFGESVPSYTPVSVLEHCAVMTMIHVKNGLEEEGED